MWGKHLSEETKRKISETLKNNPVNYWLGKKRGPLSEETRRKLSESHKKHKK